MRLCPIDGSKHVRQVEGECFLHHHRLALCCCPRHSDHTFHATPRASTGGGVARERCASSCPPGYTSCYGGRPCGQGDPLATNVQPAPWRSRVLPQERRGLPR